jgi:hypothetical protein
MSNVKPGRERVPPARRCAVDGCDRPTVARGICAKHYDRWRRANKGRFESRNRPQYPHGCAAAGCERTADSLGFCPKHYKRWRRHGDPLIVVVQTTHGQSRTPTYKSWAMMKARGITVCERWRGTDGFANFLADLGERPPGRILGRIDLDGDFTPENCRWTTRKAQYAARRRKGLAPR